MELTEYSNAIKTELALELAKKGHSLEDFEKGLQSLNTGEGVLKVASMEAGLLPGVLDGVRQAPGLIFKTFAAGGALGGLAADEMDNSVEELNKSLDREREKVRLVRRITENLKREHGIQ
jgi:hypothetical protein